MSDKLKLVIGDKIDIVEVDSVTKLSDLENQAKRLEQDLEDFKKKYEEECSRKQEELDKVNQSIKEFA